MNASFFRFRGYSLDCLSSLATQAGATCIESVLGTAFMDALDMKAMLISRERCSPLLDLKEGFAVCTGKANDICSV